MATLKDKIDQLEKAAQAMGEAMYSQQGAQGADNYSNNYGSASSANDDDDVVDAEFTEKA